MTRESAYDQSELAVEHLRLAHFSVRRRTATLGTVPRGDILKERAVVEGNADGIAQPPSDQPTCCAEPEPLFFFCGERMPPRETREWVETPISARCAAHEQHMVSVQNSVSWRASSSEDGSAVTPRNGVSYFCRFGPE